MADEDNVKTEEVSPHEAQIERIGLNRILLIISLVVTLGVALIAGGAIYMTASSIPDFDDQANSEAELLHRIGDLEDTLRRLSSYKQEEMEKMQAVADQAAKLQEQCSAGLSPDLLNAMQQREKDFQQLIVALQTSSRELATMTRGSRDWLVAHDAALSKLRDDSVDRAVRLQYIE